MKQATKYSDAIKASFLSKALAPNAPSVIELAKEFNIPNSTGYTWISNMKNKNNKKEKDLAQRRLKDQSAASKFQAVMETFDKHRPLCHLSLPLAPRIYDGTRQLS